MQISKNNKGEKREDHWGKGARGGDRCSSRKVWAWLGRESTRMLIEEKELREKVLAEKKKKIYWPMIR